VNVCLAAGGGLTCFQTDPRAVSLEGRVDRGRRTPIRSGYQPNSWIGGTSVDRERSYNDAVVFLETVEQVVRPVAGRPRRADDVIPPRYREAVMEGTPRIRLVAIPADAVLVVRGDELEPEILRADAIRFRRRFADWGRYGVSAFVAVDDDEIEVLCETRLERFATVVVFRIADLVAAEIEVVPTFRRPHITVAHVELDSLVSGLRSCEHRSLSNPNFDGGGR
jgi:hypothetical protein